MAAGSQALKGSWALFVQAAVSTSATESDSTTPGVPPHKNNNHSLEDEARPNTIISKASPTRLVNAVISPALCAFVLP